MVHIVPEEKQGEGIWIKDSRASCWPNECICLTPLSQLALLKLSFGHIIALGLSLPVRHIF